MSTDPRDLPIPADVRQSEKIKLFVRELAYGFDVGDWQDAFYVYKPDKHFEWDTTTSAKPGQREKLNHFILSRWHHDTNPPPSLDVLKDVGYLKHVKGVEYVLTQKSLDLLPGGDITT